MDRKKIQLISQQPTELIIKGIRPKPVKPPVKDQQGEKDSGQSNKQSQSQEIVKPAPVQNSRQHTESSVIEHESASADTKQILACDEMKQDSSTQTDEISFNSESNEESNENQENLPDSSTQTNSDVILQTDTVDGSQLIETEETGLNLESDSDLQAEQCTILESAKEEINLEKSIQESDMDINIRVSITVEEEIMNVESGEHDNKAIDLQTDQEIESIEQPNASHTEEDNVKSDEQDINTETSLKSEQEITQNSEVEKGNNFKPESNDSHNNTEAILQSSDQNTTSPPVSELDTEISEICLQEGLAATEPDFSTLGVEVSVDLQLRDETNSELVFQDSETVEQILSRGSTASSVQVNQQVVSRPSEVAVPQSAGAIPRTSTVGSRCSETVAGPSGISRQPTRPQGSRAYLELLRRRFMHPMTYQQRRHLLAECLCINRLNVPPHLHARATRARRPRGVPPRARRPRHEEPHDRGEDAEPAMLERQRIEDALINGPPFIENGWMGNVTPCDYSTAHHENFRQTVTRPRRLAVPPAVLRTGYGYSNNRPSYETTQRAHFRDPEQLYGEQHAARRSRSLSPVSSAEQDAARRSNSQSPVRPVTKQ